MAEEYDNLPQPLEADPSAVAPGYESRAAAFKRKREAGFKVGFGATSLLQKQRAGELANVNRKPVTIKKFSWE